VRGILLFIRALSSAALLGGALLSGALSGGTLLAEARPAEAAAASAVTPPAGLDLAGLDLVLARAQELTVAVTVERREDVKGILAQPGAGNLSREARAYFQRPPGCATGMRLDREHVLTAHYNVLGKVDAIKVTFPSGLSFPAAIAARSEFDDLALLRLETVEAEIPPLPREVPWAESSAVRAGRFVFVAGRSPDPLRVTLTRGIVSAVARNGGRVLQTDAEMNYGNVGGPIIDLDGNVVGLAGFVGHTRFEWGINSGIGFGVRADTIQRILPRLRGGADVRQAFIGVGPGDLPPAEKGFRVGDVREGSAAAGAGLAVGDVIVEIDGDTVASFEDLRRLIYVRDAGDTVRLKARRGDDVMDLEVTLGTRPER
jgi:S1-C subfamily serine protease